MAHTFGGVTLTAGELIAQLQKFDPSLPVILADDGWYRNVVEITFDAENEDMAAVIESSDDYDGRQFGALFT